ncbi:restriction endonuclease subunit S [Candidatus Gracilibacteria bacterium]|nr:restriction endonuclease subunit S [Candidatus Gracilibacteria bacterium]
MLTTTTIKKGYKQTELGVIPTDWYVKTINEAFNVCNKLRLPISEDARKSMQGKYPYYGPTKIQDYLNEYRVDGEYALIGEDGDHFLKWGEMPMTQIVYGQFNVNNHAHLISGKNNIALTKWFYYFFQHRDITQHLSRQGAGRYKLSKSTLIKIQCVIPSTTYEQTAICGVLYDIDELIEQLEKIISKKKDIKQGMMQQLLTGKKRLPGFRGKWKMKQLGEIAEMSSGGTPLTSNHSYYGGQIPWVVIADMTRIKKYLFNTDKSITEAGVANSSAKLFKKGTLLFAMYASIGKCAIAMVDVTCNQAILGISTKNMEIDFLYYHLASNELKFLQMGQTGTQNNLNKEIVRNLMIPYPSLPEQAAIATVLSDMDMEIEKIEQRKDKYTKIKQGMMQQLLTGNIRIYDNK